MARTFYNFYRTGRVAAPNRPVFAGAPAAVRGTGITAGAARYRPLFAGIPGPGIVLSTASASASSEGAAGAARGGGAAAVPAASPAPITDCPPAGPWPPFTTLSADALEPLLAAVTAAPGDLPLLRSALSVILACPELAADADGEPPEVHDLAPCLPWLVSVLGSFVEEGDVVEATLRLLCAAATPRVSRGLNYTSQLVCFALGVHRGEVRVVGHGVALLRRVTTFGQGGQVEQLPFVLPLLQRYRGRVEVVRGGVGLLAHILTDEVASLDRSTVAVVEELVLGWLADFGEVRGSVPWPVAPQGPHPARAIPPLHIGTHVPIPTLPASLPHFCHHLRDFVLLLDNATFGRA